jgi:uncharacterized membrane protein YciS (DUF1049 family)
VPAPKTAPTPALTPRTVPKDNETVSVLVSVVVVNFICTWMLLAVIWTMPGAPWRKDIVSLGLPFSILFLATIGPVILTLAEFLVLGVVILPIFVVMAIVTDVQWLRGKLRRGKAARDAAKDDVELVNR